MLYSHRILSGTFLALIILLNPASLLASTPLSEMTKWHSLSKKFSCTLSSNVKRTVITPLEKQQHKPLTKYVSGPIFNPPLILSIKIRYKGSNTVSVAWDKRFYRMLWEKNFLLITTQPSIRLSSNRAFLTANIGYYPARKKIRLVPNTVLRSKLDLAGYVGAGMKKGEATFQLYVTDKGKKPIAICNSLKVMIH